MRILVELTAVVWVRTKEEEEGLRCESFIWRRAQEVQEYEQVKQCGEELRWGRERVCHSWGHGMQLCSALGGTVSDGDTCMCFLIRLLTELSTVTTGAIGMLRGCTSRAVPCAPLPPGVVAMVTWINICEALWGKKCQVFSKCHLSDCQAVGKNIWPKES